MGKFHLVSKFPFNLRRYNWCNSCNTIDCTVEDGDNGKVRELTDSYGRRVRYFVKIPEKDIINISKKERNERRNEKINFILLKGNYKRISDLLNLNMVVKRYCYTIENCTGFSKRI